MATDLGVREKCPNVNHLNLFDSYENIPHLQRILLDDPLGQYYLKLDMGLHFVQQGTYKIYQI